MELKKSKITLRLSVLIASFLMIGLLASAFSLTSSRNSLDFFNLGDSEIFTINSDDVANFTFNSFLNIQSGNAIAEFLITNTAQNNVNSVDFNMTLNNIVSSFPLGIYSKDFVINAENSTGEQSTRTIPVNYINSFCRDGPQNSTDMVLDVLVRNRGEGKIDEWRPLDKIEVQVRLTNNHDIELRDVMFKIGLFEKDTSRNIIEDMIWVSFEEDEYDVGDVRERRSSARYTFEFRIDPNEINIDKDYYLVVKAYPDGKENQFCIDYSDGLTRDLGASKYFGEIRFRSEGTRDKMVVIDDYVFTEKVLSASCNQDVTIFANVYNIGSRDFEDRIKVELYNRELGISVEDVIFGDLYAGERTTATLSFRIPRNATEKTYPLYMRTFYDYRERDDIYREVSNKIFTAHLTVEGNCVLYSPVKVAALLTSEAKENEEMLLKFDITNLADSLRTYEIQVSGYSSWAELLEISSPITVNAGQTGESIIKMNLRKNSKGTQTFNINVYSDNELVASQPILVEVEPSDSFFSRLNITGFSIKGENTHLWVIGILNVIIVLAIIIVAIRISRKK